MTGFIAQFTENKELPNPKLELDRIISQTEPTDESTESDCAWFGTRKGKICGNAVGSTCIVFCKLGNGRIDGVEAEIVEVSTVIPDDPVIKDFYRDCKLPNWWKVKDPRRVSFRSLDEIRGQSTKGKRASDVFAGSCTFSSWNFTDGPGASVSRDHNLLPSPCSIAQTQVPSAISPSLANGCETDRFYGVDFSGGQEQDGINRKIWIASWCTTSGQVTLKRGSENGFGRADLAAMVANDGGWWIFDFPFGIHRNTAKALSIHTWEEWLRWCRDDGDDNSYPTRRRDAARVAIQNTNDLNTPWSLRREVDDHHGTTWFPLFEQLYRQTIRGAAEVLYALNTNHSSDICVYPWGDCDKKKAFVAEGFPGVTIRQRLNLPATGYKGRSNERLEQRKRILAQLKVHIPIPDPICRRAVEDFEGDAIDALVLLLACKATSVIDHQAWKTRATTCGPEGWFFA